MKLATQEVSSPDKLAAAFEHSITWEDDVWQSDPVDVPEVHDKARRKFYDLLDHVTGTERAASQARILLFHGQSGAGKTHLIRALRTGAHRQGKAYVGYAQMTPDISNYADYFLRRLINSLEKPYDPDAEGESGLARLTRLMVEASLPAGEIEKLREDDLDENALAKRVLDLADDIVASDRFLDQELDINIVKALLYLQRSDPRIDQRIRQYLFGRQLNELSQQSVRALDPNSGDGRAFEIIEAIGTIMSVVDGAALVFCIDQVEDLRNFDDPEERFYESGRQFDADCQPGSDIDRDHIHPRGVLRPGPGGPAPIVHRSDRESRPGRTLRKQIRRRGPPNHRKAARVRSHAALRRTEFSGSIFVFRSCIL